MKNRVPNLHQGYVACPWVGARPAAAWEGVPNHFVRGFVAAGLLSLLQNEGALTPHDRKRALRRATQGGCAVAAGMACANALEQGHYISATVALAVGAAGITIANQISPSTAPKHSEE